jgi:hypothetical protein
MENTEEGEKRGKIENLFRILEFLRELKLEGHKKTHFSLITQKRFRKLKN